MAENTNRFLRQLDILPPEKIQFPIVVIGAGAIGSATVVTLAKMGCSSITVWDYERRTHLLRSRPPAKRPKNVVPPSGSITSIAPPGFGDERVSHRYPHYDRSRQAPLPAMTFRYHSAESLRMRFWVA